MMDCERYGANVFEVIDLINRDYPRGGIALPGLTAGTCLRKDFAFSEERSNAPGMLLAVSRVNESVPLFLVEGIRRRLGDLRERKIAVLGLAFKADTDDERDSLSHKLIRLLERELADVAVHDPVVATPTQGFEDAVTRRRRGRRGHQPLRVLRPRDARGDRSARERRLPGGRPVERVRGRAGVRLRLGAGRPGAGLGRLTSRPDRGQGAPQALGEDRPERSSRALLRPSRGPGRSARPHPAWPAHSWARPISSTSSSTLTSMPLEMFSAPSARLSAAAIQASATSRT